MSGTREELSFDFVVVGGGLAGISAAIAAARGGARTALVGDRPVLGGNSSSEVRVHIGGATASHSRRNVREGGIPEEWRLGDRIRNHQPYSYPHINSLWDLLLLDAVKREPNLTLFLNTSVREAVVVETGRIAAARAVQLGTEKEFMFRAPLFCDASGDGTLAASAGADFHLGREARGEYDESLAPEKADHVCMGASLLFKSMDVGHPVAFEPPEWAEEYPAPESLPFKLERKLDLQGGYWWIELGGCRPEEHTVTGNERIRDRLLAALLGVWDHIKNRSDRGAGRLALEWVGMVPGKREGRRFLGDYVLNENDVRSGRVFPDAVAYGGWSIDLHVEGGLDAAEKEPTQFTWFDRIYTIPYRCLYSRNVENLFMAGRVISASHVAFGSSRVMGTLSAAGQAAGSAAAMCLDRRLSPRELGGEYIEELQQLLLRDDCYVPELKNADPADVARTAKRVTASSSRRAEAVEPQRFLALDARREQIFPVRGPKLEALEILLESTASGPVTLSAELLPAEWGDDFRPAEPVARTEARVPSGRNWVEIPFDVKVERGFCRLALSPAEGVSWGAAELYLPGLAAGCGGRTEGWRQEPVPSWWTPRLLVTHCLRQRPSSMAYTPLNVVSGQSRAETWTNLWASDPDESLPQWIEVELAEPARISQVQLTFDTNIDRLVGFGPTPECVRDYDVELLVEGQWRTVAEERGNWLRMRRHSFEACEAAAIRVTCKATNGSNDARIFEMRAC